MNSLNDIVRNQIDKQLTNGVCDEASVNFTDVLIGTYEMLDPENYIENNHLDGVIQRIYEDTLPWAIYEHNDSEIDSTDPLTQS